MTKTKSQKLRKAMGEAVGKGKNGLRNGNVNSKAAALARMEKDWNFLNGNSFSFLNTSAAVGSRKKNSNIGKQVTRRIGAPVAKSFVGLSSKAKMTTLDSGITRVKHSEYVKDIDGSQEFEAESFPINPGTSELFPWLSSIAERFESYQFRNLTFRYETTSPTSTPGSVILTVDYNPNGIVPTSKVEALAMESAVRTAPWGCVQHRSLGHNLTKRKSYYVRAKEPVLDNDLYDTGLFVMMVEGVPTDMGHIGEMYVDYEVDLITPVLQSDPIKDGTGTISGSKKESDTTGRYPFEEDVTYTPETLGDYFVAGPNIAAPNRTVGKTGTWGGFRSSSQGQYLFVWEFETVGSDPLTELNFGFGAYSGLNLDGLSIQNLTPGGTVAMVNATANKAIAMWAIAASSFGLNPNQGQFVWTVGVGTDDTLDNLTCNLRVTKYHDSSFPSVFKHNLVKLSKEFKNLSLASPTLSLGGSRFTPVSVAKSTPPANNTPSVRYCDLASRENSSVPFCGRLGCFRCGGKTGNSQV